jgi:hypothetical protein
VRCGPAPVSPKLRANQRRRIDVTKEKKERLAIRLFHIIEGEADGRFAISALLVMVFGILAWRFFA